MKLPPVLRFGRAEVLFSLKTFASGMLAMYIANRAGLPRAFWALLTAYVVANPLAGAVRSKALYRFIGTLIGSSAAVLMVPSLSNAPELLTLALALWVGFCLYVALLDRTPRAYVFMLSGYTAALIGFPSVQAPLLIFDTAVARVEEIGLAILCATLVHSIVLPAGLAPSLLGLLDRTVGDARQWLANLVAARQRQPRVTDPGTNANADADPAAESEADTSLATRDAKSLAADRRRLAADMTQLRLLSTHVPFDTTHLRWTAGALRSMQDRIAALTPVLSAVEDRLAALEQAHGGLAPDVEALLAKVGQWLEHDAAKAAGAASQTLTGALTAFAAAAVDTKTKTRGDPEHAADAETDADPALDAARFAATFTPWERSLRIGLAAKLAELVEGWQACAALRRDIDAGMTGSAMPGDRGDTLGNRVLHRDHGLAALSAFAAVLAICLCSAFWIFTGWSSGSAAAMMAAVFCCFFAALDDPVPAIHGFLEFTLWSVPVSALYVLVAMPLVHDFGMLVVVCAPVFLLLGCTMARPASMGQSLALVVGVAGTLALHDTASVDIASFVNSTTAQVLGIVVAARVTRLVRSVGADWSARRIQRAIWRELGATASSPRAPTAADAAAYSVRMLDRIGLLAPRIALGGATADAAVADDALRDLRVGADVIALQRVRSQSPWLAIGRLLDDIGTFFARRGAGGAAELPASLLADIDRNLTAALAAHAASESDGAVAAITALVGLRRNLFPNAPAVLGAVPPPTLPLPPRAEPRNGPEPDASPALQGAPS